jgi:uncharacterized membrane protein YcaP (DUF421 family)
MEIVRALIGPDEGNASAFQLSVRAVVLLAFGILCIRIAGRRTFSQATPLDIIVAIIVGSNLSRAMTGKAPFFPDLAATLVLVGLHRGLAMATVRWSLLASWIKSEPVTLVSAGVVDRDALRRMTLSEADLMEGIRLRDVGAVSDVELASLEASGEISVVPVRR